MVEQQFLPLMVAVGLVGVHLLPDIVEERLDDLESEWESFVGGIGISYVFIHMLPEIHEVSHAMTEGMLFYAWFARERVWLIVLFGLIGFYVLSDVIESASEENPGVPLSLVWIHLGSFALYNGICGYMLMHPEILGEEDFLGLTEYVFFFVSIGLHFYVNDIELRARHGRLYRRLGRFVLAGSILAGTLVGVEVTLNASVAVLFAFVAGGMILNIFRRELPDHASSNARILVLGAIVYTVLLQFA